MPTPPVASDTPAGFSRRDLVVVQRNLGIHALASLPLLGTLALLIGGLAGNPMQLTHAELEEKASAGSA